MMLRVLVVEDEALVAAELECLIAEAGHTVVGHAVTGEEALALAAELTPNIALVDVNLLDGATGVGVARRLLQDGVQVIFMTANPKQVPPDALGSLGVLAKPYPASAVHEALAAAAA